MTRFDKMWHRLKRRAGVVSFSAMAVVLFNTALYSEEAGKNAGVPPVFKKPYSIKLLGNPVSRTKVKNKLNISVVVLDAGKKPVSNLPLRFSLELAPMEASGTALSASEVITDEKGKVNVVLTLGDREGTYRVSFSSEKGGISSFYTVKAQSDSLMAGEETPATGMMFPVSGFDNIPALPALPSSQANADQYISIKPAPNKKSSDPAKAKGKPGAKKNILVKSPETFSGEGEHENTEVATDAEITEIGIKPLAQKSVIVQKSAPVMEALKFSEKDFLVAEARIKLKVKTRAGQAEKIFVKPASSKLPADGKSKTVITVTLKDVYGNPVEDGTIVTLQSDRGSMQLKDMAKDIPGIQSATSSGGLQFALVAPEDSGTAVVLAMTDGLKAETKVHFYGMLNYILVSPVSQSVPCGSTQKFQTEGYDKNHEPVTVIPSYVVEGKIGTVDPKTGIFTAKKSGRGKIVASSGVFKGFADVEVVPGSPRNIVLSLEPKTPSVNQNVTLASKVFDAFGNPVTDVNVKFAMEAKGAVLDNASALTSQDGIAIATFTLDAKVSSYKIIAYAGGLKKSVAFKSVPGELTSLKITPPSFQVSAGLPLTFKVHGEDSFGNRVAVKPKFMAMGLGRIDQSGQFVSHKAGSGTVMVSAGKLTETASVTVLPAKPVRIDVRSLDKQVTVGGETNVKATVYDSYGNPVPDVTLYFKVLTNGAKFSVQQRSTDQNGTAEATLKVPTKVSDVVIEVVSPEISSFVPDARIGKAVSYPVAQTGLFDVFPNGIPDPVRLAQSPDTGSTLKIKVVSAEPQKMTLKAYPAKAVANGSSTSVVSVEVRDEFGNLVEKNIPVTFMANLGKIITTDEDVKSPGVQVALKNGKAQILLQSAKRTGNATVSVHAGPLSENVFVTFIAGPPVEIKLSAEPAELPGDGKSLSKISIRVSDKTGNGISEKSVLMTVDPGGLKQQPEHPPVKSLSVPVADGEAVCYFSVSMGAGKATIKATLGSLKSQLKIVYKTGAAQTVQVSPDEATLKAGNKIAFKATAMDEYGNALLTPPLWGVLGDASIDEKGVLTASKPGKVTVIARVGDTVGQTVVTVVPGDPAAIKASASVSEAAVGTPAEILASLFDKFGNPIPGDELRFQLVSQEGALSASESKTDGQGNASVSLTLSPHTGLNIVKVIHKNKMVRGVQVFVKGLPGMPASLSLQAAPQGLTSKGFALISARVMDVQGNLVQDGTSVTFTTTAGMFATGSAQLTVPIVGGVASTKLLFEKSDSEAVVTALAESVPPTQMVLKKIAEPYVTIEPKTVSSTPSFGSIPPIPQFPASENGSVKFKGKHIVDSIQCSGCDIRWLLTELSKKGGVNIVADGLVKGETTILLQDVPVEEALAVIVRASGFTYEKIGESYLVSTLEKLQTLPQTEVIPMKEAQAKEMEGILSEVVKDVNIKVDKRTNSIIVTAPRNKLLEVKRLVYELDGPVSPNGGIAIEVLKMEYADPNLVLGVLIEMKIGTEEGASIQVYNPSSSQGVSGSGGAGAGTVSTSTAATSTATTGATGTSTTAGVSAGSVTSSAVGNLIIIKDTPYNITRAKAIIKSIDIQPKQIMIEARIEEVRADALKNSGFQWPEQLSTTFTEQNQDLKSFSRSTLTIATVLKALETSGDARTLSSPRIATVDGKAAFIHIGDNIYYKQPSVVIAGGGTTGATAVQTFEWKSVAVGIILNITPRVTDDGYISVNINNTVSTADIVSPEAPPNVKQRTAQSFVRVKDKETIILGGLISNDDVERMSQVPILSKLPILGSFFKNRSTEKRQSELFIFLTPSIMK